MFGFGDDKAAVQKQSSFKFGLNMGVYIKSMQYKKQAASEGKKGYECLEIVFCRADSPEGIHTSEDLQKAMFFPPSPLDKQGNVVTDPQAPEFKDAYQNFNAMMAHIMRAFLKPAQWKSVVETALANQQLNSFEQYINLMLQCRPEGWQNAKYDIFLQYQWKIGKKASRTYLEPPTKNMKHGFWFCKHRFSDFAEQTDSEGGLFYHRTDSETQKVTKHPFTRTNWFMTSNFAKPQQKQTEFDTQGDMNFGDADFGSPGAEATQPVAPLTTQQGQPPVTQPVTPPVTTSAPVDNGDTDDDFDW